MKKQDLDLDTKFGALIEKRNFLGLDKEGNLEG